MRTTAWALLPPYTRMEHIYHVGYVSKVCTGGHKAVYSHQGRSSYERVGQNEEEDHGDDDPFAIVGESEAEGAEKDFGRQCGGEAINVDPNNPGHSVIATKADPRIHAGSDDKLDNLEDDDQVIDVCAMVELGLSLKSETGEMSKQLKEAGTKTKLKVVRASEPDPLFPEERDVFTVTRSPSGKLLEPAQSATVADPLRKKLRKQALFAADKELRIDLRETVPRGSVDNFPAATDRGECTMQDLLGEEGGGRIGRKYLITLPEGVTTNSPDMEARAEEADTIDIGEPVHGSTPSPQESVSDESTTREGHDSRISVEESSGIDHSDVDSDGKVRRDAANPGSMERAERVRSTAGLERLSADEVEDRLIEAGILHRNGVMFDMDELNDEGVYNEVDVPDGSEAGRILMDALRCDEAEINHLRDRYAPLRGEPWYRREPIPGSKVGKKVLDVFFLEKTLPELLDLLLGKEGEGGVGLTAGQASDAGEVVTYLRDELGLDGMGELAAALARCPPMLMYNAQDNLQKKVQYYRDTLSWSKEDIRFLLAEYPDLLSIKLEYGVIEVEYLRSGIGLQPSMVSDMIRQCPQVLEARPKRLKAVVKYLWKVFEIPLSGVAMILSRNPRACFLEAEANLAPLRHFFEQELFFDDSARIGRLVYKFPRLLFQDVETQLKPRAEEFRKAMGFMGVATLPSRVRPRPKRNNYRLSNTEYNADGRGNATAGRARRKRPNGGRFGGKEGRQQERRGYRGQSSRNR